MRLSSSLFTTLVAVTQFAAAAIVPCCTSCSSDDQVVIKSGSSGSKLQHVMGDTIEFSYIVKVRDDVSKKSTLEWVEENLDRDSKIVHDYEPKFFNAFSGFFSHKFIALLRERDDIEYIRPDAVAEIARIQTKTAPVTQYTCPWGLHRISQPGPAHPPFFYPYDTPAGAGVDVYVVDTGIFLGHSDFGGRATWGYTAPGLPSADGNGHGTHCAAIAAGTTYGVAKNANLIAVKVMDDDGLGAVSHIIAGIEWVTKESRFTLRPSVISINIRVRPGDIALDAAVQAAMNEGVHVVVPAGNDNVEASTVSPARVSDALTVGAMDITDAKMIGSNFGASVDMYAPGVNVLSAWIGHPWASAVQSGTSTAAPYVAGIVAYNLGIKGKLSSESLRILIREKRERTAFGHLAARL